MNKNDVVFRIGQARNKARLVCSRFELKNWENEAYISRLESKNDSFEPSVSALLEIISACGMTETEFFYYDMNQYKKDKEIIDLLKNASPITKESIINLLKNR